jgi:hypothetical protein
MVPKIPFRRNRAMGISMARDTPDDHEDDLVGALERARYSRRRIGAVSWRIWLDAEGDGRVIEQFVVASWSDHLRQHERVTRHDQARLEEIRAMTDPQRPTTVTHWVTPRPRFRT